MYERLASFLMFVATLFQSNAGLAQPACQVTRHKLTTPALTAEPYIDLQVAGKAGPWLIDFGATMTSVSSAVWPASAGAPTVRLTDLAFPGVPAGPRTYRAVPGGRERLGVGLPHGTIGTDILKDVTTELHFENASDPHVIIATAGCAPKTPDTRFFRIRQTNFFSARPETHRGKHANVPVVFIELSERSTGTRRRSIDTPRRVGRTWAQVDTGYGDTSWPYSIDINDPYLRDLKRVVPSLVVVGRVVVSGCGTEASRREVYAAPGWTLTILNEAGEALQRRSFDSFYFVVKPASTACGGIGPMQEPAAQLGSTFLRAFGTTIFMPRTAELWIKPP